MQHNLMEGCDTDDDIVFILFLSEETETQSMEKSSLQCRVALWTYLTLNIMQRIQFVAS